MKKVQVLGTGCKKCKMLFEEVKKAGEKIDEEIIVEKVENLSEIMKFNVMSTPALVVDGEVKFTGKTMKAKDLERFLK